NGYGGGVDRPRRHDGCTVHSNSGVRHHTNQPVPPHRLQERGGDATPHAHPTPLPRHACLRHALCRWHVVGVGRRLRRAQPSDLRTYEFHCEPHQGIAHRDVRRARHGSRERLARRHSRGHGDRAADRNDVDRGHAGRAARFPATRRAIVGQRLAGLLGATLLVAFFACGDPYLHLNPYDPVYSVSVTVTGPDSLFSYAEIAHFGAVIVPAFPDTAVRFDTSDSLSFMPAGAASFEAGPTIAPPLWPATKTVTVIAGIGAIDTTYSQWDPACPCTVT